MSTPPLTTPWVPIWPLSETVPAPVTGKWLKGSSGAMVWSDIVQADVTGLPAALTAKQDTSAKGAVNGYAGLGSDGKVPAAQLPPIPPGYTLPGRLGAFTGAPPNNDWNQAIENGWYMGHGGTCVNAPHGSWTLAEVINHNAIWVTQRGWDFTNGPNSTVYQRRFLNGSWSAWEPEIIQMTQAEYNAATKYANTLYIIVG